MTVFDGDSELLRRFRAGDREALSTVYWFYVDRVERALYRGLRLTPWDAARRSAEVDDLAQEVFVRAFAERVRYAHDATRPYGPFLMTVARNALVDLLRRSARERHMDPGQIELLVGSDLPTEHDESPWADAKTMALVERYVAGLSEPEQRVYFQRYTCGRSQAQSAEELGLSRRQLRTLEARVRAGLSRVVARARLESGERVELRVPGIYERP
jgi:RNA polymerase sigma factor (sigma-70 family)